MEKNSPKVVYNILDQLNITYEHISHDAVQSMEDCAVPAEKLGAPFCKNLFLANRQQTEFYLLLIDEKKKFKTSEVSKKIGTARLSFGNEEMLYELLGVYPGAITAMGLIHDKEKKVHLVIDNDLMKLDKFSVHACVNTESLWIATEEFKNKFLQYTGHEPVYIDIEG